MNNENEYDYDYDYDVDYSSDDSPYITNDKLSSDPVVNTVVAQTAIDQTKKLVVLESEDVEYEGGLIEPNHYLQMSSNKANEDFKTTTSTPVAPSVQNLSASPASTWKKPVLIGAACLAAIWFLNND